jgi:GDP-D-mannose 3', 5'-epimerase
VATAAHLSAAFLLAFVAALAATPLAIRVARRTAFYDHPEGYKAHRAPTPYLGGAAVLSAFALGALFFADGHGRFGPVLVGALGLWAIGTIDDRRTLRPRYRLTATSAAGGLLWTTGLGWSVFDFEPANLLLTVLWVVALVNAFNLMDNIDGAMGAVAFSAAIGIALFALSEGDTHLAALAFCLVGASLGFLRYNLASPARVFLGDGGSMPVGFVLGAGIMSLPLGEQASWPAAIAAGLLVSVPAFDTVLVILSRYRRRVTIWAGGRDHLTHRLLPRVGSSRAVAVALGAVQAALAGVALTTYELGPTASAVVGVITLGATATLLAIFENRKWTRHIARRPVATRTQHAREPQITRPQSPTGDGQVARTAVADGRLVVPITTDGFHPLLGSVRNDAISSGDRVLVTGGGGFLGGHLVAELRRRGFQCIRSVDVKPFQDWYQLFPDVENIRRDLRQLESCKRAVAGASVVFNLASDMGGMGFIEGHKADCMLSVLINTHMLVAARAAGVRRFLFGSSACVYAAEKQSSSEVVPLKEEDAYPAMPEDGYGWEKLFGERMCRHFYEDFGLDVRLPRYHNVYGPHGTFTGGREKAPAAICRKVVEAKLSGTNTIEIWGDGQQTRSFTYIEDAIEGTLRLMSSSIVQPINVGSSDLVTINELVDKVEEIAGVRLERRYNKSAPQGVRGRNSDNAKIRQLLRWEPSIPLEIGLEKTYRWIYAEMTASKPERRVLAAT